MKFGGLPAGLYIVHRGRIRHTRRFRVRQTDVALEIWPGTPILHKPLFS